MPPFMPPKGSMTELTNEAALAKTMEALRQHELPYHGRANATALGILQRAYAYAPHAPGPASTPWIENTDIDKKVAAKGFRVYYRLMQGALDLDGNQDWNAATLSVCATLPNPANPNATINDMKDVALINAMSEFERDGVRAGTPMRGVRQPGAVTALYAVNPTFTQVEDTLRFMVEAGA